MAGAETPYDKRLNALGFFGAWAIGVIRNEDKPMTIEEFIEECERRIEAMRGLGRTARWQNTLSGYSRLIADALNDDHRDNPWRYADWAVVQGGIYASYDAQ
jgi:hypothetical protein